MCRLFAQISPLPLSAEKFLVGSEFSLLRQSDFKKNNLQKDGWGVARFGNKNEPWVSKSPKPVFKEKSKFIGAARPASKVVIGHIRAASNPRGIPKNRLINMGNSQPYTDGRWVFAHNGTLQIPDEVAAELGPLRRKVKSLNDSEVYFWQFVKFYRRLKSVPKALQACIREDWALWKKHAARHPDKSTPYTSLNVILSDGRELHAFCHAARRGLSDCGVCNPSQPWSIMSFSKRPDRVLVASENLDRGSWTRFSQPELVSVSARGGRLSVRRRRLRLCREALAANSSLPHRKEPEE